MVKRWFSQNQLFQTNWKNYRFWLVLEGPKPIKIDKTSCLKRYNFLTSILNRFWHRFFRFGVPTWVPTWANFRKLNSKNRFFSLSWATQGQLRPKGRPKRPQETQHEAQNRPKTVKMRSKGIPREPQRGKKKPQHIHITDPSLTRPPHIKPVTHQTGDPPFLD